MVIEIVLPIVALSSVVAGLWLIWDVANTIAWYWVLQKKPEEFEFYSPFFIKKVKFERWTLVFDIGMTLILFGFFSMFSMVIGVILWSR